MKVLRSEIEIAYLTSVLMGAGSKVLAVAAKGDYAVEFWWTSLDDDAPTNRLFAVVGTGQVVPEGGVHWGTAPRTPSGFVWHLFEVSPEPVPSGQP